MCLPESKGSEGGERDDTESLERGDGTTEGGTARSSRRTRSSGCIDGNLLACGAMCRCSADEVAHASLDGNCVVSRGVGHHRVASVAARVVSCAHLQNVVIGLGVCEDYINQ